MLRDLKDPRIVGLLSIVRVKVSGDLSYATVYVSAMEGLDQSKKAVSGLKSAAGYLRRELSLRLQLRKSPELRFVADNSIAYGAEINRLIEDLEKPNDSENPTDDSV